MRFNRLTAIVSLMLSAYPSIIKGQPIEKLGQRLAVTLKNWRGGESDLVLMSVWKDLSQRSTTADIGPCLGPVCILRTRPQALRAVASDPQLRHLDLPGRLKLRMDQAGPLIRLPQARDAFGFSGRGVLIAVIDTGLDWTHPDFIDENGNTRVAWLLDQTRQPTGGYPDLETLGGGAVYSSAELQTVLDGQASLAIGAGADSIGHGTLIAGIALGNDVVYRGVAPGARLVAVKLRKQGQEFFGEDQVVAAMAFTQAVAQREDKPLVINLSLGTQLGAHDGSAPLELAIDALVQQAAPPIAVVVAAGNERLMNLHARGEVRPDGEPLDFLLAVPSTSDADGNTSTITVDFWYPGTSQVQVEVIAPSKELVGPVGNDGPFALTKSIDAGTVDLSCSTTPEPQNGDRHTLVVLKGGASQPLQGGKWRIRFSGRAERIDGWIGEFDISSPVAPRFLNYVDPTDLVGPPATARMVIAVGASVSRNEWQDADGSLQQTSTTKGSLSAFSSPGPTRDGRFKPEVIAPGEYVAAALSTDTDPLSAQSIFYASGSLRLVTEDGRHALAKGTSMAAPIVAGLAALLFEQNPSLTGEHVRDRLTATTMIDSWTGQELYNLSWGFGKADVLRPLQAANAVPHRQADSNQSLCGVSQPWLPPDNDSYIWVVAIPRDAEGLPLGPAAPVEISSDAGWFSVPTIDPGNGQYLRPLHGKKYGEEATLTCHLGEQEAAGHPRVLFVSSYSELTEERTSGGGCSCGQTHSYEPILLLGMFLVFLRRLRLTTTTRAI